MPQHGIHLVRTVRQSIIRQFARLFTKPLKNYATRFPNNLGALKRHIRKGDIILVEGEQRISEVRTKKTKSRLSQPPGLDSPPGTPDTPNHVE